MTTIDTQKSMILDWLKSGKSLTPLQAITHIGCTKASSRVGELCREGHKIQRKDVTVKNRFGKMTRVKCYYL